MQYIRAKKRQLGLHDAATQFDRGLSDVIDGADEVFHQLSDFIRAAVVGLAVRASRQCLIS
jgi:hypothetical protein